jgi:SNF2 family DNA or RNA helicase
VFAASKTDNYRQQMKAVRRAKIVAGAKAESDGRFLVSMRIEAGPVGDAELRRAIASRQYYAVSGESIWLLPPDLLERISRAQEALSGHPGQALMPSLERRLAPSQLRDAENVLDDTADKVETPEQWKMRSRALKEFSALKAPPLPPQLDELLRSYQRIGAAWMWHLRCHELGGVLADEMGLGKTIQAIALISAIRSEDTDAAPVLVVCPAGLVENWIRELTRFAPWLRLARHHGAHRIDSNGPAGCDVVITSYQTLTRDCELFLPLEYPAIVADEAQHIKNRRTQAAAALRSLRAKARFVLTGTPIENSLDDLRSIFAFILPGYLSRIPEGMRGEDKAWYDKRHLAQAAPYILRRSKSLVAPELPPKIEQTLYCEFSPAQSKMYQELVETGRKAIFDLEMGGASEGRLRMEALTRLLRLRQTCADPRILRPEMDPMDCAKLRALEEIMNEAIDGGHRLLVFSQFVEALKLIAASLEERGIPFCYLDGSTRNRSDVCDRFNGDDTIPVMLISLKAGGTGLNLTGADMVVHFDPWWNPAVEAQATDRAHRIGQTRKVTSIKLIAAGSVEEKVLELQRTKAALLEELLDESAEATARSGWRN